MANEEMQRAIEFLVQQQAEYAVRLERDEVRLARLEESFKLLVELARGADERQDTMGETMATLSHTMDDLVQTTIRLREAELQANARLTEFVRGTDDRLTTVDRTMATLSNTMTELAKRTDRTMATLSNTMTELAKRTDRTMATLSNTMNELVERMIKLAEAQRQADAISTEFARGTDDRFATVDRTMATLSNTMNELGQSMSKLAEAQR